LEDTDIDLCKQYVEIILSKQTHSVTRAQACVHLSTRIVGYARI